jgi:uncharacterized protein with beta-barrel porin domain
MRAVELRRALLATSSIIGLVVGIGNSAQAAPCAVNNSFAGLPNTGAINCVSFNDGANHIGDVVNANTGTITPTGNEGGPLPGTASGISVVAAGTKLTGNITNNGTITASFAGINVGGGAFGTTLGAGATVTGTITNNGTITNSTSFGIDIVKSNVGGSIINNNMITSQDVGINLFGTSGSPNTVGGSVINNGTINLTASDDGMAAQFFNIAGSFSNTGTINAIGGSAALSVARGSVAGSITNSGTINATGNGFLVDGVTVGGSVTNTASGTINGNFGFEIQRTNGFAETIAGDVSNAGKIVATGPTGIGIGIFNGTVAGSVLNSGTISSVEYGILLNNIFGIANTTSAGAINNSGMITSNGTGFAGIALAGGVITNGVVNTATGNIKATQGAGILLTNTTPSTVNAGASSISGGIVNQGTITAKTGIMVTALGTVAGGISNSGSITGSRAAIDVTGEGMATTINQQAGTISGAILLSTLADTVNITGGTISGDIVGQGSSNTVNFAPGAGNTFTYSNAISGVNAVNVNSGILDLTGSIASTLTTVNSGGVLNLTGSITSTLTTVNSGGVLTGTGTVGDTTVAGGFAPGNGTPGTFMNVSGNLAFQSGALYLVQLNPAAASFAQVTGTAMLGGATVNAIYANGSYVSKQYIILTATGGVSGTFASLVNTNLPKDFTASLSFDAHDVFLNLTLGFVPPPTTGLNQNQQNVANALTNFFNTNGSIPLVFGGLTAAGLTQISGETATGTQQTTFDAMTQFMGVMTDPSVGGRGDTPTQGTSATPFAEEIDAANAYAAKDPARSNSERDAYAAVYRKAPVMAVPFVPSWSVWAAGFGGSQTTDGNAALGSNSTTSRIGATAVGADYRFSPATIAGFALASGGTNFSVNGFGSGHSDLFQAGAFVRHTVGPAYFTAALAYGWQDITTNRTVTVAGVDQLQARFNANAFSGRIEDGYRFATPWMGVTPYAAAQFTTFDLPAYAEQAIVGAGTFALSFGAKDVTDSRSEIGLRTDKSWAMTDSIFTLRGRFAWAHDYNPDRSIGATFQTLPGASFVVNGAAQSPDKALTTASAEIKWRNGFSLAATFDGEFSGNSSSYAGKGVARYTW